MAETIKLDLDQSLSSAFSKKICDAAVPRELLKLGVSAAASAESGDIDFGFAAGANASVEAFNSPDDVDEAGVIAAAAGDVDQIAPQIALEKGHGWLKYQLTGQVKGSAQTSLGDLGLSIKGKKEAVFSDYRTHPCDRKVFEALLIDSNDLRIAARLTDIDKLAEGEALAYQLRGELKTSLSLSLIDTLTAGLDELAGLVASDVPLTFKVSSGATVAASVAVTDDFMVVFSRASDDSFRVAVKKARGRQTTVSAKLGVRVTFADPGAVKKWLDGILEGLVGHRVETIDAALDKLTLQDLSSLEKSAVGEVQKRLGLGEVADQLETLRGQWTAFKKKVESTLTKVATFRAEAGFAYEYSRVRENATLLQAVLDARTLKRFHGKLMKGRITDLVDWLRDHESALENYLHQKKITTTQSWGFSLGFIGGTDKKTIESIVRTDFHGRQQIIYEGRREYQAEFARDESRLQVDFKAGMPKFVDGTPHVSDFNFGLALDWQWREKKVTLKELASFIDLGVVWQVLAEDDRDDLLKDLGKAVKDKKKVTVAVGLTFQNAQTLEVIEKLHQAGPEVLAPALGAAMPWWPNMNFPIRTLVPLRRQFYGPVWEGFFRNNLDRSSAQALGRFAADTLRQNEMGRQMAVREQLLSQHNPPEFPTFAGQVQKHPDLRQDWTDFKRGLKILNDGRRDRHRHDVIQKAFGKMQRFWRQPLYVRALGPLLLDCLDDKSTVERTFTVTVAGGNTTINVGSNRTA